MLPWITTSLLLALPADAPLAAPATSRDLLDRASAWVVAIRVERAKDVPSTIFRPRGNRNELRSYYERPDGHVSGILLDGEGHVLTSLYNVAGEVKSIQVTAASGKAYAAKLVARSPQDDVALLRLEPGGEPLPGGAPVWAEPSSGARLRAGQLVFVLGRSPDPSSITVTRGIISAASRNGGRAIQTDAELNYGNSGGPIVDLDGRIVAMAAFVGHTHPQWGLNSGVGFGVTAGTISDLLTRLKAGEDAPVVRPAFLGVQCDRDSLLDGGAKVTRVVDGGGAAKAGVRPGDLIIEVDSIMLEDFDHLRRLIFLRKVSDALRLKVRRGEETLDIEAVLGAMPQP